MFGLVITRKLTKTKVEQQKPAIYDYFTPNNQPDKPSLVAHWFKDENSQLCCKWVKE